MKDSKKPGTFLKKAQDVLGEVLEERIRQHGKWGEQNLDDSFYSLSGYKTKADEFKKLNDNREQIGHPTWDTILLEEVYEALSEPDMKKMREELLQVAAVCVSWVECLDRREK